jgi:hypothetical protein
VTAVAAPPSDSKAASVGGLFIFPGEFRQNIFVDFQLLDQAVLACFNRLWPNLILAVPCFEA